jgi:hypothetical protein
MAQRRPRIRGCQTTVTRYWTDRAKTLSALRSIEETEGGFLVETRDGKIKFEDRHYRMTGDRLSSVLTFSDASDTTYPYEGIRQEDPLDGIFNIFEATVTLYTTASIATLWTAAENKDNATPDSRAIASGESVIMWAQYPHFDGGVHASEIAGQTSVDTWTTPVATTDYTVHTVIDGSGTDLTGSVGVAAVKYSNAMKITLTNNHASDGFITTLKARGTAVVASDPVIIRAEDADSKTAYLERTFSLSPQWLPTTLDAQGWVDSRLFIYKDPLPRLTINFTAGKSQAVLNNAAIGLDISSRVTVTATGNAGLGINEDFFVENIRQKITQGKTLHQVAIDLSPAKVTGGFWALGYGLLGKSTAFIY